MDKYIKNIDFEAVLPLVDEVEYLPGKIISKTLAQNRYHSLTLFAFDQGEEISTHSSNGDAMVICLDGCGKITIEDNDYVVHPGQTIIMPAGKPHAVYAEEKFKMLLTVIFV